MAINGNTTIVAPATAHGKAGVAVIRLSGPSALEIAVSITHKTCAPRMATYSHFYDAHKELLDCGLCITFPAPASYTGEDVVELHCHGSMAIVAALVDRCIALGAVLAEPGAFTKRAFLNGKLDLFQAEAVASLIDAENMGAVKSAARSLQGIFSKQIMAFLQVLVELRVLIEAHLDFAEEDIDALHTTAVLTKLATLQDQLQALVSRAELGQTLQEGIRVVLTGPTNAGKSSLFNAFCGVDAAIVTDHAGTTRDVLHRSITLGQYGLQIELMDTAGLRESTEVVEQEGMARSRHLAQETEWLILLLDAQTYTEGDFTRFVEKELNFSGLNDKMLLVLNKIDCCPGVRSEELDQHPYGGYVSAMSGEGITELAALMQQCMSVDSVAGDSVCIARRRHVLALQETQHALTAATQQMQAQTQLELVAEHLRLAQEALGQITGEFTTDDLLGEIFGAFCIGK